MVLTDNLRKIVNRERKSERKKDNPQSELMAMERAEATAAKTTDDMVRC